MERNRVVRTVEALVYMAFDQAGKPEGTNAYSKAIAWCAKYAVRASEVSPLCARHANALHLVFAPEPERSQHSDWRSQYNAPPPPRSEHRSQDRTVRHRMDRPYHDYGECQECGNRYERGKDHSGMHARYCSPSCFEEQRRRKARERMSANRQRARKGP